MAVLSKVRLYIDTVKHLKPSQVLYRAWRRAGGKTRLKVGYAPAPEVSRADIGRVPTLPELDFDPAFLARFDVSAIMEGRIELLHHEEEVDWELCWHEELSTPLWRFNLHYFEYLLPLAKAYIDTGEEVFLSKAKSIVLAWIESCPEGTGGAAWDPYVISMRIVNWLAFYGEVAEALGHDKEFVSCLNRSLAEQYVHLSQHLEKDLLANHFLENLKALVILACYFDDGETLDVALRDLYEQVDEQILPDGMHFELSPMYHKIVLEDLMRVALALHARGHDLPTLASRLLVRDMCDCLYSLERNTNRTPLFNDSGDNVAKSRHSLLACAESRFDIVPAFKPELSSAGYCILERDTNCGHVKLIVDVGRPGPEYAMGHAHCDALSFECYVDGKPWVVNLGTFAYQDALRLGLKATRAHSAICLEREEQYECWAPFRVADFGVARLMTFNRDNVRAEFTYPSGATVCRIVQLAEDGVYVQDVSRDAPAISVFHFADGWLPPEKAGVSSLPYAPNLGQKLVGYTWSIPFYDHVGTFIPYPDVIVKELES